MANHNNHEQVRAILWRLLRPVLVAMIVAFLTALGVSVEVSRQEGRQVVSAAGVTHFSGLYSYDDVQAADDVIVGDDLTVGDGLAVSGNLSDSGGSLRLNDDTLVTGTLGVSGVTTFGTFAGFTEATAISVTTNGYITPTGLYQPLTSFGNVYTGLVAVLPAGRMVVLTNESNTTITISDTSTTMLSGNVALGQYDTLVLWSDGTNMVQLATSNN